MQAARSILLIIGAMIVSLAFSAKVGAVQILNNRPWYEFSFTTEFSTGLSTVAATGCFPVDPDGLDCVPSVAPSTGFAGPAPWTFSVADRTELHFLITDAFERGDYFDVYDNGRLIEGTPRVSAGPSCGDNPRICFGDLSVSFADIRFGAGDHSIVIMATPIDGAGAGFFRLVPEPPSWSLLGGMMVLVGVHGRRLAQPRAVQQNNPQS